MFLPVAHPGHGVALGLEMDAAHRHVVAAVADGIAVPRIFGGAGALGEAYTET